MLAFKCKLHRMLGINQCLNKHCSCQLQSECIVRQVLEALYRVGSRWQVNVMVPIGGAKERPAIQQNSMWLW
jgi:hypothetical protein